MDAIKDVSLGQLGLASELIRIGHIVDGISVAWRWMCNAALTAFADIEDAIALADQMI